MDRRTLSIQLYPGKDDKIALWYDAIEGNRQEALKAAIAYYIDYSGAQAISPTPVEPLPVLQPDNDAVLQLREVLIDGFNALLDQLPDRIGASVEMAFSKIQMTTITATQVQIEKTELNREEIKRRDTNMRKTQQW